MGSLGSFRLIIALLVMCEVLLFAAPPAVKGQVCGAQGSGAISTTADQLSTQCIQAAAQISSPGVSPAASAEQSKREKKMHILNEFLESEDNYAKGLDVFFYGKRQGKYGKPKTLFQKLLDEKLIKKEEFITFADTQNAVVHLTARSQFLAGSLRPDFSAKADPDSLVKMERALLTHFDPETLENAYAKYVRNFDKVSKLLLRIGQSEKGKKIISKYLVHYNKQLRDDGRKLQFLDTNSALILPVQRFLKYELFLRDLTKDKLSFEPHQELVNLLAKTKTTAAAINGTIPNSDPAPKVEPVPAVPSK